MPYGEWLEIFLPTLKYIRYRGDIVELFKIWLNMFTSCRFHGIIRGLN